MRRGVGIAAEAAVFGAGLVGAVELMGFVLDLRFCAGEGERVDGRVGVAELVEGFGEIDMAALVEGFADQEDGAAVGRRLLAEQVCGEGHGVEHGRAVVAGFDAVELGGDLAEVGGEAVKEFGFAVKVDDCNAMRDVADDGVEQRTEAAVLVEIMNAVSADLDDHDKGERL